MRDSQAGMMMPLAAAVVALMAGLFILTTFAAVGVWRGNWGMGNWGMMGGTSMNQHMQQMMGGVNSANATPSLGGASENVTISNLTFTPGNLVVPVGATVTWTNEDPVPHTATARDGAWDTGLLNKGDKKSITFSKPGDYEYYCKVHPAQVAHLTVR